MGGRPGRGRNGRRPRAGLRVRRAASGRPVCQRRQLDAGGQRDAGHHHRLAPGPAGRARRAHRDDDGERRPAGRRQHLRAVAGQHLWRGRGVSEDGSAHRGVRPEHDRAARQVGHRRLPRCQRRPVRRHRHALSGRGARLRPVAQLPNRHHGGPGAGGAGYARWLDGGMARVRSAERWPRRRPERTVELPHAHAGVHVGVRADHQDRQPARSGHLPGPGQLRRVRVPAHDRRVPSAADVRAPDLCRGSDQRRHLHPRPLELVARRDRRPRLQLGRLLLAQLVRAHQRGRRRRGDRRGGIHHAQERRRRTHLVQDGAAAGQAAVLFDRGRFRRGSVRHEVPGLLVLSGGGRRPYLWPGVPGRRGLPAGGRRWQEGAGRGPGSSLVAGHLVAGRRPILQGPRRTDRPGLDRSRSGQAQLSADQGPARTTTTSGRRSLLRGGKPRRRSPRTGRTSWNCRCSTSATRTPTRRPPTWRWS